MRKPFIAGNWKMNMNIGEAQNLARKLKYRVGDNTTRTIAICPNFTALYPVYEIIKDTNIKLGSQNVFYEEKGAFTGETSADMILSAGCSYTIIGHSERRQYFGETNEIVNKKIHFAIKKGILPIFCIGETIEERESNQTKRIVETQLKQGLKDISFSDMVKITIAYEPVWAIGTGKTASPEQAEEVHAFIRNLIKNLYNQEIADKVIIQYGGSVKPNNVDELMSQPDIDGALVGGASLKEDDFVRIIEFQE